MICHHHKCIFIHIPKNAGQSIEHVFLNLLNLSWETRAPLLLRHNDIPELGPPRLAHLKADEYVRYKYMPQEMFITYFKFTFVRNPWDRTVSIYKYLGFNKTCSFKIFLLGTFRKEIFNEMNWFVGPQSNFIYGKNGDLLVDYIGKFENLQNDFNHVCTRLNIPIIKLPHINESKSTNSNDLLSPKYCSSPTSPIKNILQPSEKKYRRHYDEETIEIVANLYKRDINLFNYEF